MAKIEASKAHKAGKAFPAVLVNLRRFNFCHIYFPPPQLTSPGFYVVSFAAVIRVVTQRFSAKRCVTTLITAAKETSTSSDRLAGISVVSLKPSNLPYTSKSYM